MKTPVFETSAGALNTLLGTRQFVWAGLYKVELLNGLGTYYYTTADADVLFNSNRYLSPSKTGALFERKGEKGKIQLRKGLEVGTLQFTVLPNGAQINGVEFLTAIKNGVFDGAKITFYHAYWAQQAYTTLILPVGVVTMFGGSVASVSAKDGAATFTVNSLTDRLNQNLPRNIYQAGCIHTLYNGGCALNPAGFSFSGTTVTGTTASNINAVMAQESSYFDLGKITFTSGANNGISRGVKLYEKGTICSFSLMSPFPYAPAIGDTFTAYAGCDKTKSTCANKFNNLSSFLGFPFIPENTTGV